MKAIKEFKLGNYIYYVIGISVIGKKKTENQDCFLIDCSDSCLSIAVADGLGSAVFSQEGANKLCRLCIDFLKNPIEEKAILKLREDWKKAVKSDFDKYDSTIKFIKMNDETLTIGGVGDGWICFKGKEGVSSFEAEHTFSNQTDSILSIDLLSKFVVRNILVSGDILALISTDGFSEDIEKSNLSELLLDIKRDISSDIYRFAADMEEEMKNWPVDTNCDDKTVVFVLRKELAK